MICIQFYQYQFLNMISLLTFTAKHTQLIYWSSFHKWETFMDLSTVNQSFVPWLTSFSENRLCLSLTFPGSHSQDFEWASLRSKSVGKAGVD